MSERLSDIIIGFGTDEQLVADVKALTEQQAFGPATPHRKISGFKFRPSWLDASEGSPIFVAVGHIGIGESKEPTSAVLAKQRATLGEPDEKYLVILAAGSVPTKPAPEGVRGHAHELIAGFTEVARNTGHKYVQIGYTPHTGNPRKFFMECGFERMDPTNPGSAMVHRLGSTATNPQIYPEFREGVREQLELDVQTVREQQARARQASIDVARTSR